MAVTPLADGLEPGVLSSVLPRFDPMLAANRPARVPAATWALEPKLDGWRALVYVEEGWVEVRTRRGRAITEQLPELAGLAEHVAGRACPTASSWPALADRETSTVWRQAWPAAVTPLTGARRLTFVAFDVLWLDDGPTVSLPYAECRQLLGGLERSPTRRGRRSSRLTRPSTT